MSKRSYDIVYFDDRAELIFLDQNDIEKARAVVSLEDILSVLTVNWWITEYGYVRGKVGGRYVFLHRFLLNPKRNEFVDHKNRNKLDCRRENLRICTKAQNSMNRDTPKNNRAGYTGVSFEVRRGKYRAYIKIDGKQKWIGYFNDFESAKAARMSVEQELFGEFAPQNESGA